MKVLVAGATGVIGRALVPLLASGGHEVIGLSRSVAGWSPPAGVPSQHVAADALDAAAVTRAIADTRPDAVVNLLTAIPAAINPKRFDADFAMTNRLRTEGTRNLLAAARDAGVRRVITESVAFAYDPAEAGFADEDVPLWRDPPKPFIATRDALVELEDRTSQAGGLVLRFGHIYGPGTSYAADGSFTEQVRRGRMPIVGGGTATFSFVHTSDAASAIVAALDRDVSGVLNIVDDEPVPAHSWLPAMAALTAATAPKRVPAAVARLAVGSWGVAFMTQLRGAANDRAKAALNWQPGFANYRDGFAAVLGDSSG